MIPAPRLIGAVLLSTCLVNARSSSASRVESLLSQWAFEEAARELERQKRALRPNDPRLLLAQGVHHFYRGNYAAAQKLLVKVKSSLKARQLEHLRQLAGYAKAANEITTGFVSRKNSHFVVATGRGPERLLAPFAIETLEAIRERLARTLGFAPRQLVRVEFYNTPQDLARVSPLSAAEIERTGTVALCKYGRLMLITPRSLLRGYPWRDTLAHEYVHLVVGQLTRNRAPVWLQEGLAKHFESRWRPGTPSAGNRLQPLHQHLLAQALGGPGKLLDWSAMHPSLAKLPDQRHAALAFAQAQAAVALIADRGGSGHPLRKLLERIRDGVEVWSAVASITGLDQKKWQSTFVSYLRQLGLRERPGLVRFDRQFGRRQSRAERLAELSHQRSRRFFRLADMLRQHNRPRAAIVEYQKARALVGKREPFVANALARTQLELRNPSAAIDVLLPVVDYYPELAGPRATLGIAYLRTGNRPVAAQHLLAAMSVNPFSAEVHCGLAQAIGPGKAADRYTRLCHELRR